MQVKACWSAAIAAGMGLIAWRGTPVRIGLAGAIPILLFTRPSRLEAFGAGFAYYSAASPVPAQGYASPPDTRYR